MLRALLILALFSAALCGHSQSVKDYYRLCNTIPLNSKFDLTKFPLPYERDKYSYGKTYRLECEDLKTLYSLPIIKILIHVVENDTVNAIQIYLPFDSILHKRMEADLGPSKDAWMAFEPGQVATSGIIWDRRWFLDEYMIWFRCTRYISLRGETKDDFIILNLMPRRKED